MINRYKAAHERCRELKFNKALPEFGECRGLETQPKLGRDMPEARWESWVFLVVHDMSQEQILGTTDGTIKSHGFKQKENEKEI